MERIRSKHIANSIKCKKFLAKWSIVGLSLGMCLVWSSCGQNEIQLPEKTLQGIVDGEEWEMKFANAYIYSSDFKYQIKFLSTLEGAEDPCTVPSTSNAHISIIMQLRRGSFSIPLPIIDESARFIWSNGSSVIAASGFLEIFDIDNSRIFGYLQAQLDDENTIEGSFEAFICN
ncbi:MAG: hypothetical protein ABJP45_01770 [Cyclobacteriaceae bacterium]